LDETLVHSSFTQVDDPDFILSVRFWALISYRLKLKGKCAVFLY
jgi:hypothetical protein